MARKRLAILAVLALVVGVGIGINDAIEHRARVQKRLPFYTPFKSSLYYGLKRNDFSYTFVSPADKVHLRERFAFIDAGKTEKEKALLLVSWIDEHLQVNETMSVRAVDILEAGSGACETHGLAVGVLESFGIKARWISGAKSSIGFGYLEAYVDGRWNLFQLRSGGAPSLEKSAWDLYRESEPSLAIRTFWWKPAQSTKGWKDTVYPALFMFQNVTIHPELETIFTTAKGLPLSCYRCFNPYDYVYGYYGLADSEWILKESVWREFQARYSATDRKEARWADLLFVSSDVDPAEASPR